MYFFMSDWTYVAQTSVCDSSSVAQRLSLCLRGWDHRLKSVPQLHSPDDHGDGLQLNLVFFVGEDRQGAINQGVGGVVVAGKDFDQRLLRTLEMNRVVFVSVRAFLD